MNEQALSIKEKIELLNNVTVADIERLRAMFPDCKVGADDDGRVWVRADLRKRTREAVWVAGVTQVALAERLGMSRQNFGGWINGRPTLPCPTVEEILFLLDF